MGFPVIGSEGMFLTPQLCALGYRRWLQGSTVLHYFRQSSQSVFPSEKDQSAVIAHARRSVKFSGFQIFIHGMICLSDILLPHSDRHKSCSGRKTNKQKTSSDRTSAVLLLPASDYVRLTYYWKLLSRLSFLARGTIAKHKTEQNMHRDARRDGEEQSGYRETGKQAVVSLRIQIRKREGSPQNASL